MFWALSIKHQGVFGKGSKALVKAREVFRDYHGDIGSYRECKRRVVEQEAKLWHYLNRKD